MTHHTVKEAAQRWGLPEGAEERRREGTKYKQILGHRRAQSLRLRVQGWIGACQPGPSQGHLLV